MSRRPAAMVALVAIAAALVTVGTAPQAQAADPEPTATEQTCITVDRLRTNFTIGNGLAPTLSLPQFDPALGEFLRAEFTGSLSAELDDQYEIFADPQDNPYLVTIDRGADATLTLPDSTALVLSPRYTVQRLLTSLGTTPRGLYTAPDGFAEINTTPVVTASLTSTNAAVWVGTSTIDMRLVGRGFTQVSEDGGNAATGFTTVVSGSVCAQYFYIPVAVVVEPSTPEPSVPVLAPTGLDTGSALGVGALALALGLSLGVVRRRVVRRRARS